MIPVFQLPSDPSIEIQFREATISEALEFSGLNPVMSESIDTIFLNSIQNPENFHNSGDWSVNDRKTAIVFYAMNTSIDNSISITYNCPICEGQHDATYDIRELMSSYKPIKGKPFRESVFDGRKIVISPIDGSDAEKLQSIYLNKTNDKDKNRAIDNEVQLMELVYSLDYPEILEKDPVKRSVEMEGKIRQLPFSKYKELSKIVNDAQLSMSHGIDIIRADNGYSVIMPPTKCRLNKEGEDIVLHSPFRHFRRIPLVIEAEY